MTVSFVATRYEASEDDEALEFIVTLSEASSQEVTADYATVSGTATAGEDYKATIGTLSFPAGTTEQTVRVPIIDDDVVEEEETFMIRLSEASNATIGIVKATGVIIDDDLPKVLLTTDQTVVEEGETVTFTLTRLSGLTVPLTVPVDVTERGAFLADGTPTEVTFAANAATTTLQVATVDDEVDEENGAVTATITSGDTYEVGDAVSATVEITDNDGPDGAETQTDTDVVTRTDTDVETQTDTDVVKSDVTVSFAAARYEASEDDAALRFAVQLSTASSQEVTVKYATASGTATAGEDYEATIGTLTFRLGSRSGRSACPSLTTMWWRKRRRSQSCCAVPTRRSARAGRQA